VLKLNLKSHWLALCLLPVASLFFIGGPDGVASPTMRYAWNLGHIVFFAFATIAFFKIRPFKSTLQVFTYLAAIFLVSFGIEFIQRLLGRSFSTIDILRNLVGCTFALFIVARPFLHISALSFLSLVFAFDLTGFVVTAWTDVTIQQRKPIIENFESEIILGRWKGDLELSTDQVIEGDFSAKAVLIPGKFSGISFTSPLRDWSGHQTLEINVFNPSTETKQLTVRIDDETHVMSGDLNYSDRFNRSFDIVEGWNRLSIPLTDIKGAPKSREFELNKVHQVALFMTDVIDTQTLYFDNFVLAP
jgi:hypothetical protein